MADLMFADQQRYEMHRRASEAMLTALWAAHPNKMRQLNAEQPVQRTKCRLPKWSDAHGSWNVAGCQSDGIESAPHYVPQLGPISREPCPRCGVRGDIGCKHRRGA